MNGSTGLLESPHTQQIEGFGHSGTGIALSIHLPGYRSIGYPPTQSRPHKKVRTRPIGTHRHGLIKNAFFETAVPPLLPRH